MTPTLLCILLLAQAPTGHGPSVVHGAPAPDISAEESRSSVHTFMLRPNRGTPVLQVVGAEGAQVQIWLGPQRVMAETLPVSLRAVPEVLYTVQVQLTPELSFQKKVMVHVGTTGILEVWRPLDCSPPPPQREPAHDHRPHGGPPPAQPPPGPVAMNDAQFESLVRSIRAEARDERKLALLQTAMQRNHLYIGQVGALVDLFSFGDGRVGVVRVVRGHIVDPENAFVLYEHFRFDSEKEQAQRLLEER